MQNAGVNNDSAIVLMSMGTESSDATTPTRLYWTLKYYGHDDMAVLDGGMAKWLKEKRPVSTERTTPPKGNFQARAERKELLATPEDVSAALEDPKVQIVDGRTQDYYLGLLQKKYVYAPGHVSTAKNLPHPYLFQPKPPMTFRPQAQIAEVAGALGLDTAQPAITYCDSGHLSTGHWFVMHEMMGNRNVKLFDGSMHQWTKDKSNPVTSMKVE